MADTTTTKTHDTFNTSSDEPHGGNGSPSEVHKIIMRDRYCTSSLQLVNTPKSARTLAQFVAVLFITFVLILYFVPWIQTVSGTGNVTSFSPSARPQSIRSPITGRLGKWMINEGASVKQGDTLVILKDLKVDYMDSTFIRRLEDVRDATIKEQGFIVETAKQKVEQEEQKLIGAKAAADNAVIDLSIAKIRYNRAKLLLDEGLVSQQEYETAVTKLQKAQADSVKAFTTLESNKQAVLAAENTLKGKRNKAESEIQKAELKLANSRQRQDARVVLAPFDGVVVRINKRGSGETVKESDGLAEIVPRSSDQAVEIMISSRDAAIVEPGREVRLQFSGFPAFIFSGWPNLTYNTFGGKIAVVDAVDNGKGYFRVLVVPSEHWPSQKFLRQGTPVNGWIMLEEVPIGFELWRQLNGFPPILPQASSSAEAGGGKGKK